MSFRRATLPPAHHTAARATATVRRRRQVRIGLAAAAVALLLGVSSVAVVLLRDGGPPDVQPASPSASAPSSANPSPTADPALSTSDLTLSVGSIQVNGSAGVDVPGDAWVAIRNNGPDALDQIDLTFTLPDWLETTGSTWGGCQVDTAAATTTCTVPAPEVGATRAYAFDFVVQLTLWEENLTVAAQPHRGTDPNPADNAGVFGASNQGGFDTALSAGPLISEGTTGTVSVELINRGDAYHEAAFFTVTFSYSPAVRPDPASFVGCVDDEAGQTIQCQVLAPRAGSSFAYTYEFIISPELSAPELSVSAWPEDTSVDENPENNEAVIGV